MRHYSFTRHKTYDVIRSYICLIKWIINKFYNRFYRLNSKRELGSLFGTDNRLCPEHFSGIGNISFVKDILTDTIVTTRFNCSKFGTNGGGFGGWVRFHFYMLYYENCTCNELDFVYMLSDNR